MVNFETKKQNKSNKFYKLVAEVKKHSTAIEGADVEVAMPKRMTESRDNRKPNDFMTTKTFRKEPLRNMAVMKKAIRQV